MPKRKGAARTANANAARRKVNLQEQNKADAKKERSRDDLDEDVRAAAAAVLGFSAFAVPNLAAHRKRPREEIHEEGGEVSTEARAEPESTM